MCKLVVMMSLGVNVMRQLYRDNKHCTALKYTGQVIHTACASVIKQLVLVKGR